MKIKEVELITGITKQNIRYYEKQGLLNPTRNQENDYREYSEEDVRTLKIIKLFRKLDMPIEEIRKILYNDIALQEAVHLQKERLEKERERLTDALNFCGKIDDTEIAAIDADKYLNEMAEEERRGAVFAKFIDDFKKVLKAEMEREFSFMPDDMCLNHNELTEELCKYGRDNNLNLVITKEGMYPEFTIDGVEFVAHRLHSRYGAVIHCERKHMEEIIPKGMSKKKYKFHQWLSIAIWPILLLVFFVITSTSRPKELLILIPIAIGIGVAAACFHGFFYNLKD